MDHSRYEALLHCHQTDRVQDNSPTPEPEIHWQSRWYAGEFGTQFLSSIGQHIIVKDFGDWNHGTGPDFQRCLVEIDGKKTFGNIELDLNARDWQHHGHADNPAFNSVILHICVDEPAAEWFTKTSQNSYVPRIKIARPKHNQAPPSSRPVSRPGLCAQPLATTSATDILSLLKSAAIYRLHRKSTRLRDWVDARGKNQALFQAVAEALGYRGNELPMRMLAQMSPIAQAHATPENIEASLIGKAGFLDQTLYEKLPAESRNYARQIWELWWKERYTKESSTPLPWSKQSNRPANHPQRRVAALAAIIKNWDPLFTRASQPDQFHHITQQLTQLHHDFWSHHFTLTSAPSSTEIALIGHPRAKDIIINALFPFALLDTPIDKVWKDFIHWPGGAISDNLKRVRTRLLGHRPDAATLTKHAWQQQGMLQLYTDFCLQDESGCTDCPFSLQLSQWHALPVDKSS